MARIESLNVLLTDSGKVYLAEQYGAVIENIQKGTIASALKNTNLSGTPGAGSYEAKRFVNRTSNAYGTARSGGSARRLSWAWSGCRRRRAVWRRTIRRWCARWTPRAARRTTKCSGATRT